jgi:transcriptional regulator with XRE-family HTH domain
MAHLGTGPLSHTPGATSNRVALPRGTLSGYCASVEQDGWEDRLAAAVGERVAHYRKLTGLSAQALADRCGALGYKIHRSIIAKLERGHRQTVTLADWLILARALHVPPPLLLVPLGEPGRDRVELLPGVEVDAWQTVKWLGGRQELLADHLIRPLEPTLPKGVPLFPLRLFEMQEQDISRWREERLGAEHWRARVDEESDEEQAAACLATAETHERYMRRLAEGVLDARRRLRGAGFDPGPLPDDVQIIDSDETDDGPA